MAASGGTGIAELPPEIASDPSFVSIRDEREVQAAWARQAKSHFVWATRLAVGFGALLAVVSGLQLYALGTPPSLAREDGTAAAVSIAGELQVFLGQDSIRRALTIVQALCAGVVAALTAYAAGHKLRETWMAARRRAEEGRHRLIMRALEIGYERGPASFAGAATWLAEDQLTKQVEHHKTAAERQGRATAVGVNLNSAVVGFVAVAAVLVGLGSPIWLMIAAFIGILAPTLTSALRSWEETLGHQRLAVVNEATRRELNALKGRRAELDAAVAANDLAAAKVWAAEFTRILEANLRAFDGTQQAASSPVSQVAPLAPVQGQGGSGS